MSAIVLLLDQPHPLLEEKLCQIGLEIERDYRSDRAALLGKLHRCAGLVLRSRISIDEKMLRRATSLRFIAREGVGLEHIDLDACARRGIEVLSSPEGSRDTVAEHALGLLLCLMNNLSRADRQIRQGLWQREPNRGVELAGKTVGILGYGNMGSAFAKRLTGFGLQVLAFDKYKTNYGDAFATAASLEELFEKAQVLSIHIPWMPSNQYFVNGDFLARFRNDIFLVNTARGNVLNTADLISCLRSGKVKGAALDVLEYESPSFNKLRMSEMPQAFHYLTEADNVVLSPHIAGWSLESKQKHAEVLAEKIERFLSAR